MSQFVKFVQGIYQNPTQFTVTDVSGDIKDIKPNFGNEIQKGTPYTASLFNEITRQISYTVKDLGTGGANSYIVQLDGLAQGDLKDNLKVILVPQANNTGACTITFNNLGSNPINIKKGNQDLKDADIIANQHAILNYNETNSSFELLNPQSGAEKVDIIQQQVDDLKDVVYTKPSTQISLNPKESKTSSIKVSGLINPKYEGVFLQNLIRNNSKISNTLISDDSGNLIGIKPNGDIAFSSSFDTSHQNIYLESGKKYWLYFKTNQGYIKERLVLNYSDGTLQVVGSNLTDKQETHGIITADKTLTANLKVIEGTSGNLSKANVIVLNITDIKNETGVDWEAFTSDEIKDKLISFLDIEGVNPIIPEIKITSPSKESVFKCNDWLGSGEVLEDKNINKQWDRILLSESIKEFAENPSNLSNVYRFYLNLKENYTSHTVTNPNVSSKFKDFKFVGNSYSENYKHQYMLYSSSELRNKFIIFIPKSEIDSLTGSDLKEKFFNWVSDNDDYLYYKKISSKKTEANISSIAGTFQGEINTFSNISFGKATFNYENSITDSLTSLSESIGNNTNKIIEDYTQKISDKIVILKDQIIKQIDWVFDNLNGRYFLEFESNLISPNKIVDINFNIDSYNDARVVLGVTSSGYGKVTLYARNKLNVDLVADVIIKDGELI